MNNKVNVWLNNWKRNLLEVFVVAGILASAFTTYKGAFLLVNRSVLVALLFTTFFQGGMYVIGHYTSVSDNERERRRTVSLCLVWIVFAFFSVYASALGMFDIQQDSLRSDRARVNVFSQWKEAAKGIAEFKTRALAAVNQAKLATTLDLNIERARVRAARAQRRLYSMDNLQRLSSELSAIQNGENKLRVLKLLSLTPPDDSDDARRRLDEAFAGVGDAYAAIPEHVRAPIIQPRPIEPTEISANIQKAFWEELKARSMPVLLVVVFALMLDLLAPMVLFATASKPTMPERILGGRRRVREVRNALRVPLAEDVEVIHLKIADAPGLQVHIKVPACEGGPLLDIDRDLAEINKEVCLETGREMLLDYVKTASGKPLVDGAPLLDQLGDEREVVLSYVPKIDSDFDIDSREVN